MWPAEAPHEHVWGSSAPKNEGEESDWEENDAVTPRQQHSPEPSAPPPSTSTSSRSPSSAPAPPISSLDDGALHLILGFLDPASLSAVGATSRRMRELVNDPLSDRELWKVRRFFFFVVQFFFCFPLQQRRHTKLNPLILFPPLSLSSTRHSTPSAGDPRTRTKPPPGASATPGACAPPRPWARREGPSPTCSPGATAAPSAPRRSLRLREEAGASCAREGRTGGSGSGTSGAQTMMAEVEEGATAAEAGKLAPPRGSSSPRPRPFPDPCAAWPPGAACWFRAPESTRGWQCGGGGIRGARRRRTSGGRKRRRKRSTTKKKRKAETRTTLMTTAAKTALFRAFIRATSKMKETPTTSIGCPRRRDASASRRATEKGGSRGKQQGAALLLLLPPLPPTPHAAADPRPSRPLTSPPLPPSSRATPAPSPPSPSTTRRV